MVKFYCMKIYNHETTIDELPKMWRAKVQKAIDKGLYKPNHIDEVGEENVEA